MQDKEHEIIMAAVKAIYDLSIASPIVHSV